MKTLVIAEKPSVGRDIARVLNCTKQKNGVIEGEKYIVGWAMGHLVTLVDPELYDESYKEWKLEDLPMLPEKFRLSVIKKTSNQFRILKQQISRNDIDQVVIATDAGREGELVARWILKMSGNKKSIRRLWISSVTDQAIKEGFEHLRNGQSYEALYQAAEARAEADWLVGMNGTRALTCKYNAQLSCGRVQTPTLALIMEREQLIKSFVPENYYQMIVLSHGIWWKWISAESGNSKTKNQGYLQGIKDKCQKNADLEIIDIQKQYKKVYAPQLYDLTELQKDANAKFGFSAKQTLNIMQKLYEHHKVLTYPRTDSRYITEDVAATINERLKACSVGPYRLMAGKLAMQSIISRKHFVDASKVSDHHAIIPTEQYVQLDKMTADERKIYDLVVRRFLAVLLPPFEYEQIVYTAICAHEKWVAKGQRVINPGWREIEKFSEDSNFIELPALIPGRKEQVLQCKINKEQTAPPAYYSEGTLLKAMEKNQLGTVATRADIIDKLLNTYLIEKREQYIYMTSKGRQLLTLVPEKLKQPLLTSEWEKKLIAISDGKLNKNQFIKEIIEYTKQIVADIEDSQYQYRHENLTQHKCPNCGQKMLDVKGKNSRLLVCQNRQCGYKQTVSRTTNARCPNCHKKLEMVGQGEQQAFVCQCGYKEKLQSFKKRREQEGKGVSKKDVARYMKQQKKEADTPVNQAFADAFAKLNLKQLES